MKKSFQNRYAMRTRRFNFATRLYNPVTDGGEAVRKIEKMTCVF